ncbi:hypothetical protein ACIA98_02720 [Streptomyces sp. NPDC051366]|uniref:hypothetical protein n=1 Tax=Streptomyces sp. NPDC051366 TaxID=3365652 RepID=UPI0037B0918A
MDTIGSGTTTIAVPVDRLTLNLEAVGHDPADSKITAVHTIPGTSKYSTLFGQFDPLREASPSTARWTTRPRATISLRIGGRPVRVRTEDATVHLTHDSFYAPRFAGQPVWADYRIPGQKGYTSGASGAADSTGDAWLMFRLIAPPAGAELDILSSAVDTSPAPTPGTSGSRSPADRTDWVGASLIWPEVPNRPSLMRSS